MQFIYICKLLYMFRVVPPPIIRSTHNCIYNIWYLLNSYCYLSLSWKRRTPRVPTLPRQRNKALLSLKEIAVIVLKLQPVFRNVKSCNTDAVYQLKLCKQQYQLQNCVITAYSNNFTNICYTVRHSVKSV
jgi:hypothetical protein